MFYEVNNLEVSHMEWSGTIYVRKNETVQESILRHFPSANLENLNYYVRKSLTYTPISNISAEDLKDFLNE